MESILGNTLVWGDRVWATEEALGDAEYVALYFSAHWCGPCKAFTPTFNALYELLRNRGVKFQVVFVSLDHNEKQWREYCSEMSWLALPYEDRDRQDDLLSVYRVCSVPSLVILDRQGRVVNGNAIANVRADPLGTQYPWNAATL